MRIKTKVLYCSSDFLGIYPFGVISVAVQYFSIRLSTAVIGISFIKVVILSRTRVTFSFTYGVVSVIVFVNSSSICIKIDNLLYILQNNSPNRLLHY